MKYHVFFQLVVVVVDYFSQFETIENLWIYSFWDYSVFVVEFLYKSHQTLHIQEMILVTWLNIKEGGDNLFGQTRIYTGSFLLVFFFPSLVSLVQG